MEGGPDLFVVCKSCQAEVSPYITECPYCGNRLRKRAPKLEKGMLPSTPRPRVPRRKAPAGRSSAPRQLRPRRREAPSWARARRPYGSFAIVVASIVVTLLMRSLLIDPPDFLLGFDDDPYGARSAASVFAYFSTGYEILALGSAFLFGWLLERRHGLWAPLLVFLAAGIGSLAIAHAIDPGVIITGGNGGALGLLGAWAVRDILVRRGGEDPETDGLGVVVLAVLLILVPIAATEAHPLAGAAGGLIGIVLGFPLAKLAARR
jgi:hypothetical protein